MKSANRKHTVNIQGYTYEADLHCAGCTKRRNDQRPFDLRPNGWPDFSPGTDENGLPYAAEDNEGNLIHLVFSTDEMSDNHCGDCGCEIDVNVVSPVY